MAGNLVLRAWVAIVLGVATQAHAQTDPAPFWDYRCPAAGTELLGSDGMRLRYAGTAPEAPTICVLEGLGPRPLGLPPAAGDWNSLNPVGLARLFQTGAGGGLVGSYERPERCQRAWALDDDHMTHGVERISIPAVNLDVVVLRYDRTRYECGLTAEFERTLLWFDRTRGVPLRVSIRRGGPPETPGGRIQEEHIDWRAVSLTSPP